MCCVEIWQGTRLCFSRDAVCGRDRKKDDPILRTWLLHKSVDRSVKRGIFNDKNVNLLHRYICTCMWENKGVTTCWDDLNLFVSRRNLLRRSQEDRATEYLCLCYLSFCGLLQMVKVKTFVNALCFITKTDFSLHVHWKLHIMNSSHYYYFLNLCMYTINIIPKCFKIMSDFVLKVNKTNL